MQKSKLAALGILAAIAIAVFFVSFANAQPVVPEPTRGQSVGSPSDIYTPEWKWAYAQSYPQEEVARTFANIGIRVTDVDIAYAQS